MKTKKLLCLVLFSIFIFWLSACNSAPAIKSADLMKNIKKVNYTPESLSDNFITSTADFSIELFKKSSVEQKNPLISPLSAMFALAMTANGARGSTLSQMESVLGGDIELLNNSLYSLKTNLVSKKKSKLNISNSIWFRDGFEPYDSFLQANADYYGASAYKSAFDQSTVDDINKWVKWKTDNMIDRIIDNISSDNIMFLINAIAFDAEWEQKYDKNSVRQEMFTNAAGVKQNAELMYSSEKSYLDDGSAKGFIKPYYGGYYSFAALLPNEDDINAYVQSLTGEKFLDTIKNALTAEVTVALPKFNSEYDLRMNNILIGMGMGDAFSPSKADFSGIGNCSLCIGEVLQKTFISVGIEGTKAAAVTSVTMKTESVGPPELRVILNRPFLYAIIDNTTNLPVFIGILTDCGQ